MSVRLISSCLPVCLLVLGVFSLALSFGSFRTTLSSDTTTDLCWIPLTLDISPQVLLFLSTAAFLWPADYLFTLVIRGKWLRGVGYFVCCLSQKWGVYIAFQSCTALHSQGECTVIVRAMLSRFRGVQMMSLAVED